MTTSKVSTYTDSGVIEFLCDRRFHRTFTLPPNPATKRTKPYRVSYADYGDQKSDAVVLFCGALMTNRTSYSPLDQLAKTHKVRILHPDRPGIGGSDPVGLHERIDIWLEIIPQLLAHLNISHVSIACHSGGIIYALNTVLIYPNLLHPRNPYICFWAPWVHQSHSRVGHLLATDFLPTSLIGKFVSFANFIDRHPQFEQTYDSIVSHMKTWKQTLRLKKATPAPYKSHRPSIPNEESTPVFITTSEGPSDLDLSDFGVLTKLYHLNYSYRPAEPTEGISQDAQLFLKRPRGIGWGSSRLPWSDMDDVVPLLLRVIEGETQYGVERRNWVIDVYHAEEDDMIGKKGKDWFDDCWVRAVVDGGRDTETTGGTEEGTRCYKVWRWVLRKTNHMNLIDAGFKGSAKWLERVRASFEVAEEG